ncbi:MAG: hypothetical protein QXU20_00245 [Candidatus Woesearchaeota archaeon]
MRERVIEQHISFKTMISNKRLDQFFKSEKKEEQKQGEISEIKTEDEEINELIETNILE